MSADSDVSATDSAPMSEYDAQVWAKLNDHWQERNNQRGLPNWAGTALERTGMAARSAVDRLADAIPDAVMDPIRDVSDAVATKAARPAILAATSLIDLFNDWALDLNNPRNVEKLARKRGADLASFADLREHDLKFCDRLLTTNTLKWRTLGALEGGSMGLLALVPVAGLPVAIGADILVIQVLSTAIASRIAYSYGFDAKDPAEQDFIQRLVRRSFFAQATKAGPLRDVSRAANAMRDRVRWSDKLRADHRLAAALETLMKQALPAGSHVSVQSVAKALPVIGVLIGAGTNSTILAHVAADAQRYCQTRFLCEKYDLPLPSALFPDPEEDLLSDAR